MKKIKNGTAKGRWRRDVGIIFDGLSDGLFETLKLDVEKDFGI
jgi:hypothetical protein